MSDPPPTRSRQPDAETWLAVEIVRNQGDGAERTLPEQIADRIASLIERGDLTPGARLPSERELARIFGVNRLAVREAAHRLEARGLVTVRRGAGSFVALPVEEKPEPVLAPTPPPARNPEELFEVQLVLEPAAADWAARRADPSATGVLLRIAARFEEAVTAPESQLDLLAATDIELHLEIARCADNEPLTRIVEQLHRLNRTPLEWSLQRAGRLEEVAAEHRRLVDAIVAGNPAAAREAMFAHLTATATSFRGSARDGNAVD